MSTQKERERAEAIETLRDGWVGLKPGDKVWTTVRHVSRSGMTRDIDVYVMMDGEPRWISGLVAKAVGNPMHGDAVRVGGCGMDMGFALVYSLSQALWPDGFGCIGEGCPSNDHSNGDRDYTPHLALFPLKSAPGYGRSDTSWNELHDARGMRTGAVERDHWHQSGGYALQQRWL